MEAERVKRFRWEVVGVIIMVGFGAAYYLDHRGEGTPTEKAAKAIEQIDTLRAVADTVMAVADTVSYDIDTLKMKADSQDIYLRKNTAQLNEIKEWIQKQSPAAAQKIEKAADTVKPKEDLQ